MQFVEKDIQLSVSQVNAQDKVTVIMESLDDFQTYLAIDLGKQEIERLANWLKESLELFE